MVLLGTFTFAQVGVNIPANTTVDPSAAFEIQSGSSPRGLLTPRMTTANRLLISSPADGLIVYDTDLKSIYHYKAGSPGAWVRMSSEATGRLNFKRIKSTDVLATVLADEKAAGGGTRYLLNTNTYYEINGTVNVDLPIGLNNAYVVGLDANEDKLVRGGVALFSGTTGGTIKNLSLVGATSGRGGTLFSLDAAATQASDPQTLLLRDCIVQQFTSVGSVTGFGLVFASVVQYVNNGGGITYNNITRLLLSNMAWFGNNSGIFEKYDGTFTLIQKLGGFMDLTAGTFGVDVSSNPTISGDAVLESVVFTGDGTGNKYVNRYTTGSYTNFNFNNSWTVESPGIPREADGNAGGGFSMDYGVGTGISIGTDNNNPSNIVKVINKSPGTTTSPTANLFRFGSETPNSLKYLGKKKRIFQVSGSISVQVPNAATYIVYLAKNGTPLTQYKIYGRGQVNGDIVVLPINGTVDLNTNDIVEVYIQRYTGSTTDPVVPNLTITLR